ncbi:MAG: hypothetical protein ACFFDT_27905, partial [Candidatus Hodarchaeota archaeon]
YRIYVNELGGGVEKGGYYFPQDTIYDYMLREAIEYINERAPQGSSVAMTVPTVGKFYGRLDLQFIKIKNLPKEISQWGTYNVSYAILQESRTFLENQEHFENLRKALTPEKVFLVFQTEVAEIFHLNSSFLGK